MNKTNSDYFVCNGCGGKYAMGGAFVNLSFRDMTKGTVCDQCWELMTSVLKKDTVEQRLTRLERAIEPKVGE